MSKSHRLAWAAGFIDGDGFITVQNRTTKHKDKVYQSHYLRLGACQASLVPLKELQSLFGGSIREKNSGPNKEGYKRKTQWVWTLSTQQAANALEQLLPYLIHKKEVALLGLDFAKTMSKVKTNTPPEIHEKRQYLQNEIARINSLS